MAGTFELDTAPTGLDKTHGPAHIKGEFDLPCLVPSKICSKARR
ncbi:MAG TPA: hypothetical protein VGM90_34415 [Kofleriaceae bacterium]|jgi:hypothetical protein